MEFVNENNELMMRFAITSNDNDIIEFYKNQSDKESSNSGFDLIITEDVTFSKEDHFKLLPLGIKCSPDFNSGYYLYPRSSICKTPLRMANSVGIIDIDYRGEIKAPVDFKFDELMESYTVTKGTRLFQICHPSLKPIKFNMVHECELDLTIRGDGGFGSTGIKY